MTLTCSRLTPVLGAVVRGVEVSQGVTDALADELHAALMEHHVLLLPEAHLAPAALADLGAALGSPPPRHHAYVTHPAHDDVVVLEWGGESVPDAAEWHADMTYRKEPPFGTLLQAIELPPCGGDTLFASMFAVHDALSPGLRDDLSSLQAVHDLGAFRSSAYLAGGDEGLDDAIRATGAAVHPIIAEHPVTGRPYLNVSEAFTRFVVGLSAPESARLLTQLFDLINRPDFHVRLRWTPGALAIWDNRGTQHYAVNDYLPHRRVMHRVVMATDRRAPV